MLTVIDGMGGERVLTVRIQEAMIDVGLISALESVLSDVERGGVESLVLQFSGALESLAEDFSAWHPGPVRSDIRYFARWDETISRLSRLQAKTFAAYDGRVGGCGGYSCRPGHGPAAGRGGSQALTGQPFRGALP
jgi:hypothetical protein